MEEGQELSENGCERLGEVRVWLEPRSLLLFKDQAYTGESKGRWNQVLGKECVRREDALLLTFKWTKCVMVMGLFLYLADYLHGIEEKSLDHLDSKVRDCCMTHLISLTLY